MTHIGMSQSTKTYLCARSYDPYPFLPHVFNFFDCQLCSGVKLFRPRSDPSINHIQLSRGAISYRVRQQKPDAQNLTLKKHLKNRFKTHK